ncbi:MAG TPA: peroxiredoxin [Geminicoccaceae bacterium]|nr:peroxiredoxin [Geminicoccaceae bacterium]
MSSDPQALPAALPAPIDDGACDHLAGMQLPGLALPSTSGDPVDLAVLPGRLVVYCFPRAGQPDVATPAGWDQIPGARGCTPQALAFRDHHQKIRALHAEVFGLSTQPPDAQAEIAARLKLPFPLLSDADHAFARALSLPTFAVEGTTLVKRLTLIVTAGRIEKVFYPVFPPGKSADEVIVWLLAHPRRPEPGAEV